MNSVDFITKVVKLAQLSPDDVKIVCSSNPLNQRKLGEEYVICKPLDPVKKFNFYTATCFEGSDVSVIPALYNHIFLILFVTG